MKTQVRCAIYARVSTSDKGQSTEMQVKELTDYARTHGLEVFRVYEDQGYSGSTSNRPMLKELMNDVQRGEVTHVLCWRLDRWFRSLKEVVNTLNDLTDRGVVFISLKDGINLESSTGRLMAGLMACFAQFELEVIRERVRSGLENARRKGRIGGRRQTIDIAKVHSLRKSGMSMQQIADQIGVTRSAVSKTLAKSQNRAS
jgi:putative DNA-invertase from lambdoid prophage Rac